MSFIVAKIEDNNLTIVSDTKLTHKNDRYKSDEFSGLKNHVPSGLVEHSVLKSTIINDKICVSFAGDEYFAEIALKQIQREYSFEQVLEILEKSHYLSDYTTDFILCTNFTRPEIYLIGNKSTEKVERRLAWIGDRNAFERFQKSRIAEKKSILAAMDDVINDEEIGTVGGFKIAIQIDRGKFRYVFNMQMNREPMAMKLSLGVANIVSHGTPAKGAYTLTMFGSSEDYLHVAFHMKQGNLGVIYSRVDNGLLKPKMIPKMDEADFHDYIATTYGIVSTVSTQDRFLKFFSDGHMAYKSGNFVIAIELFDKAIGETNSNKKVEALFYKGASFHYLKKPLQALEVFRQVFSICPSYERKIFEFMRDAR